MIMIDTKYQYPTMNLKEFSASKIKEVEASLPACGFRFQHLLYPKMLYVHSLWLVTLKTDEDTDWLALSRRTTYIYICRAVSPLNSRMATKVIGAEGGGLNSGEKDLIPAAKG